MNISWKFNALLFLLRKFHIILYGQDMVYINYFWNSYINDRIYTIIIDAFALNIFSPYTYFESIYD